MHVHLRTTCSQFIRVHVYEYMHNPTCFKPLPLGIELRATAFFTNRVGASLTWTYEGPFMSVKRLPNSSIKVVARNSTTNHDSRTAVPRKSNRCIMGGPTMHSCDLCTCVCKEKGRNDTCRYKAYSWMKQRKVAIINCIHYQTVFCIGNGFENREPVCNSNRPRNNRLSSLILWRFQNYSKESAVVK